ncbi:hypothetical protein [Sorangium sp. So ce861]|uniref:hypothetical protein n=1 Tax=Sorangium sp. So ce861 TaxID=3133323 RepID=UPI003F615580
MSEIAFGFRYILARPGLMGRDLPPIASFKREIDRQGAKNAKMGDSLLGVLGVLGGSKFYTLQAVSTRLSP